MNERLRQAFRKHLYTVYDAFQKVTTGKAESDMQSQYELSAAWLLRFVKESDVEDVWEAFTDQDLLMFCPCDAAVLETAPAFTKALLEKIRPKLVANTSWKDYVEKLVEKLNPASDAKSESAHPIPSWARYTAEQYQDLKSILAGAPAASAESKESEEQKPAVQKPLLDGTQPISSQYIFDFDGVITFRDTRDYYSEEIVTSGGSRSRNTADRFIQNRFLYVLDTKPNNFDTYKDGYVLCKDTNEIFQEGRLITRVPTFKFEDAPGRELDAQGHPTILIPWSVFLGAVVGGDTLRGEKSHALQKRGLEDDAQRYIQIINEEAREKDGKLPLSVRAVKDIEYKVRNYDVKTFPEKIIQDAVSENIRPGVADAFRKIWKEGGSIAIAQWGGHNSVMRAHLQAARLTPEEIIKITIKRNSTYNRAELRSPAEAVVELIEKVKTANIPVVYYSSHKKTISSHIQSIEEYVPRNVRLACHYIPAEQWPEDPNVSPTAIDPKTETDGSKLWVNLQSNPKAVLPNSPMGNPLWNYLYYNHPTRTILSLMLAGILVGLLFTPVGPAILTFLGLMVFPLWIQAGAVLVVGTSLPHGLFALGESLELGRRMRAVLRVFEEGARALLSLVTTIIPGALAWFFSTYAIDFFVKMLFALGGRRWGAGIFSGFLMLVTGAIALPFVATIAVSAVVFYGLGAVLKTIGKFVGFIFAFFIFDMDADRSNNDPYNVTTIQEIQGGFFAILITPLFLIKRMGDILIDLAKGIFDLGKKFIDRQEWKKTFSDNFENTAVTPVKKLSTWERVMAEKEREVRRAHGENISDKDESLSELIQNHGARETPRDIANATIDNILPQLESLLK